MSIGRCSSRRCCIWLLNAAEAMPGGGQLRLVRAGGAKWRRLRWGDTGKGIPLKIARRFSNCFSPRDREGSGIGWRVRFELCRLLNGSIDFTSEVGAGHDVPNRTATRGLNMTEKPVRSLMQIIYEERPASPTGSGQAPGGPYKSRTRDKPFSESTHGGCSSLLRRVRGWVGAA